MMEPKEKDNINRLEEFNLQMCFNVRKLSKQNTLRLRPANVQKVR
jgi:hypothetical protein